VCKELSCVQRVKPTETAFGVETKISTEFKIETETETETETGLSVSNVSCV